MSDKPETRRIRAIDVRPYKWAVWCSIEESEPFANEIVSRKWSEDGASIWFMLESHNFLNAKPDEELELVPMVDSYAQDEADEQARFDRSMPGEGKEET